MYDTDRRRMFFAVVVTLIAVPAFFLYNRSAESDTTGTTGTTGTSADATQTQPSTNVINPLPDAAPTDDAAAVTAAPTSARSQLPPTEPPDDDPIFLDGVEAADDGDVAHVAVPAQPAIAPIEVDATYLSTVSGARSCLTRAVESGRTITVTNLDNGRTITCVTILAPATQRDDLVMHTRSFEQLADLTDAPITVEIRQ
jgi:hypothetical protein